MAARGALALDIVQIQGQTRERAKNEREVLAIADFLENTLKFTVGLFVCLYAQVQV